MKTRAFFRFLLAAVVMSAAGLTAQVASAGAPLVVHEWGTFTSLQDETGRGIGGINTDDERVPEFVHRLADFLLLNPTQVPASFFKGAPRCHPDVTMRLETPVLYFHLPPGQTAMHDVSVSAEFRGGWLSEFYPNADATAPGVTNDNGMNFGPLHSDTVSTLAWRHLEVGGDGAGPASKERVWTAPRAVRAASVRTAAGEAEKFLFYRGVAHIDAPIAVTQVGDELVLRSQCSSEFAAHRPLPVKSLWLVDIGESGRVAFRALPPFAEGVNWKVPMKVSGRFAPGDHTDANREKLKGSLKDALVGAGLFDDEAQALLNTWELSYFKSPGMRVFFLVPREWTESYLPLNVSVPAEITRVMVGRIELVTPGQRNYLREIAQVSTNEIVADAGKFVTNFYGRISTNSKDLPRVSDGRESLADYGVAAPRSFQLYLALGRFRNALILEENREHPSPAISSFIKTYRLEGYKPGEEAATAMIH